jgi:hypothetical protein
MIKSGQAQFTACINKQYPLSHHGAKPVSRALFGSRCKTAKPKTAGRINPAQRNALWLHNYD